MLAEYMMRRDKGEDVEIVRDEDGGLKNLKVQMRAHSSVKFGGSANLTDANAEKKDPD